MSDAPADVCGSAHHPEGVIPGILCVGIYKSRDREWVAKSTTERLTKRLVNLDKVDSARDTEYMQNVNQLRRTMVTGCAAAQPIYSSRLLPPSVSHAPLTACASRIRVSFELIYHWSR